MTLKWHFFQYFFVILTRAPPQPISNSKKKSNVCVWLCVHAEFPNVFGRSKSVCVVVTHLRLWTFFRSPCIFTDWHFWVLSLSLFPSMGVRVSVCCALKLYEKGKVIKSSAMLLMLLFVVYLHTSSFSADIFQAGSAIKQENSNSSSIIDLLWMRCHIWDR